MNRFLNNFYSFVDSVKSSLFSKEQKLETPPVVSSTATPKETIDLPPSPVEEKLLCPPTPPTLITPPLLITPCPDNLKCSSCPCNIPTDTIIKPKACTTIKRIPTATSDLHEETPCLPLGQTPEVPVVQESPSDDFIKLATLPRL